MDRPWSMVAVQIQTQHPIGPSRSGAFGIGVMTIGVVLVCFGTVPMIRIRRWRARAFPARGRVVDNVPGLSRRGRTGWLPLIEFEAEGASVTSRIAGHAARRGWPLGYSLDVLYDPADPALVRPADAGATIPWALILGLAVLAAFFAVIVG